MAERAILTALVVLSVLTVMSRVGGDLSKPFDRANQAIEHSHGQGGGTDAVNQGDGKIG